MNQQPLMIEVKDLNRSDVLKGVESKYSENQRIELEPFAQFQNEQIIQLKKLQGSTNNIYSNEPILPNIFARRPVGSNLPKRKLIIGLQDSELPNNKISTAKYNIIDFFPKNLLIQFQKMANVYFLIIGLLQLIPSISNTGNVPTIYMPLVTIIIISMVKDAFEDLKRHQSDKDENNKKVQYLNPVTRQFESVTWQSLRVGQIIKVNQDEYFPADIMPIKSSDAKGVAYIETKNLDGETNLKHKLVHKDLQQFYNVEKNYDSLIEKIAYFEYENPNQYLYEFSGKITLRGENSNSSLACSNANFMLRGCSLRNTDWIIGVVSFQGLILQYHFIFLQQCV